MKSTKNFFKFHATVVFLLCAVVFLLAVSVSANGQNPDPAKNRPVLKRQDPSKKQPRPADPDTAAYFVFTARFDEQVEAIATDYIFQDLRKTFGDNIVVVQSLEQVPVGVDKSRVHTVNLKLTQNRLDDVSTDSLPKAVARAVLDPLSNTAAGKVEQATKVPGTGEAARIILRQGKRSANLDGQDTALRYWWTMNVQVDGLPPRNETFIWVVARHRTDDYKNRNCFNAVGLGSNFTNIEPYDTEDWLGCDYQGITPGLYNLTVKELWQRPAVKQWLATIPKPPAARPVAQIVIETEANANCAVQEWDAALKRYKCVVPKVETPCLHRRPNVDGTFTCLDSQPGQGGTRMPPQNHSSIIGESLGGTPIGSQPLTATPAPEPMPKPTPAPATPVPPVQQPPTPTPAPQIKPGSEDGIASFPGHTGQPAFQEMYFDGNPDHQMSGPNVEKVVAFMVNKGYLTWNPAWKGISFGRNSTEAWKQVEVVLKAAGVDAVLDGRVNKAEWVWLNSQDPNLFRLTPEMQQSKAKATAAANPAKK